MMKVIPVNSKQREDDPSGLLSPGLPEKRGSFQELPTISTMNSLPGGYVFYKVPSSFLPPSLSPHLS